MAGKTPSAAIVPYGIRGQKQGTDFRKEAGNSVLLSTTANIGMAKKLLKEAGYPNGKDLPQIELLYNSNFGYDDLMAAIQSQLKSSLGINVKLVQKEFNTFWDMRKAKKFSLSYYGWLADYNDPYDFLKLWTSKSDSNNTGWKNVKYDNYIKASLSSTDPKVRMTALHNAEKLILDEMPVTPIFNYTSTLLQNPRVSGAFVSPYNYLYLQYANIK